MQFLVAWIRETTEPGDLAGKTKQGYERRPADLCRCEARPEGFEPPTF
jgi:hypothetical protein